MGIIQPREVRYIWSSFTFIVLRIPEEIVHFYNEIKLKIFVEFLILITNT